ncbi:MAG: riboflavin synthase [Anaerolineae bacterium]|nr:riboflavin synthase [Phycisphaerae bacterium]
MFTGIVERTLRVAAVADGPKFRRLTIAGDWNDLRDGESIAVNGVCLTVAEIGDELVGFDVIKETLDRTNLGLLVNGDEVHVERSLRVGDRIDGHFVLGHVDGRATIVNQKATTEEWRTVLEAPEDLARFLAPKGSVALDGISLTIASLNGNRFEVALIPTTLKLTTIGRKHVGWPCNFEADILTKSVVNYLERRDR